MRQTSNHARTAAVGLLVLAVMSCLDSTTELCASGLRCLPHHRCVQTKQGWTCLAAGCGDGIVSGEEICDDGNRLDGDGCSADCRSSEYCGNGVRDVVRGEECDDGNTSSDDGCTGQCRVAICGDGYVYRGVEHCDGAEDCDASCEWKHCSNGMNDAGESDVDCGGSCRTPCIGDKTCKTDQDCFSAHCRLDTSTCDRRQLAAGSHHVCLVEDGRVFCWGRNDCGQLGRGYPHAMGDDPGECLDNILASGPLDLPEMVVRIAPGAAFTCALSVSGNVFCWGADIYSAVTVCDETQVIAAAKPMGIPFDGPAVQLAAGSYHACVLMRSGYVRCFGGTNLHGELGRGGTSSDFSSEDIQLGPGAVVQTAVGDQYSCVLSSLDDPSSDCQGDKNKCIARCWGKNDFGQLGLARIDALGADEHPGDVPAIAIETSVSQIAAFKEHACVTLKNGSAQCWGRNQHGQLGIGSPENIGDDETLKPPHYVLLGGNARGPLVGWTHTCALLENGAVRCWGDNSFGQLGYGHTNDLGKDPSEMPPPDVPISGSAVGDEVLQLAAGDGFTCALYESSVIRCWGLNDSGQLGYGHTDRIGDDESPDMAAASCQP